MTWNTIWFDMSRLRSCAFTNTICSYVECYRYRYNDKEYDSKGVVMIQARVVLKIAMMRNMDWLILCEQCLSFCVISDDTKLCIEPMKYKEVIQGNIFWLLKYEASLVV